VGSIWLEGGRPSIERKPIDLRFLLPDSRGGEGGRGLFVSAVVDIDGMAECDLEEVVMIRFVVVRYADCSDARLCSCCRLAEPGMLNQSSLSTLDSLVDPYS
jgi:hypothetical protein